MVKPDSKIVEWILLALFVLTAGLLIYELHNNSARAEALRGDRGATVVVRRGDTVDAFARCLAGGIDKRYVIEKIVEANGRDIFKAGDTLVIPASVAANADKCGME